MKVYSMPGKLWNMTMTFHLIKLQFNFLSKQIWIHGQKQMFFDGFCENTNSWANLVCKALDNSAFQIHFVLSQTFVNIIKVREVL